MNRQEHFFGVCFTLLKTALLFFALFCIYGGLDNLLNTDEADGDFIRICDIFIGVLIWLSTCQIHLPLRMRQTIKVSGRYYRACPEN